MQEAQDKFKATKSSPRIDRFPFGSLRKNLKSELLLPGIALNAKNNVLTMV